MRIDSPPAGFEAFEGAEIFNYGHVPAAAAYCRRLGLVEVVNDIVPSQMNLEPRRDRSGDGARYAVGQITTLQDQRVSGRTGCRASCG